MCFGIFSPFEDKAKCRKADTGPAEPGSVDSVRRCRSSDGQVKRGFSGGYDTDQFRFDKCGRRFAGYFGAD